MGRFLKGLKFGAILGALAGLLLSPKSGKENRRWIKENTNQENINKVIKKGKNLLNKKQNTEPIQEDKKAKRTTTKKTQKK